MPIDGKMAHTYARLIEYGELKLIQGEQLIAERCYYIDGHMRLDDINFNYIFGDRIEMPIYTYQIYNSVINILFNAL